MNSFLQRAAFVGLVLTGILWAESARAGSFSKTARGTSTAVFLNLPTNARSAALGGTMAALSGNAASLNENPAGLARLGNREFRMSHSPYLNESSASNVVYAQRVGDGVLAVGFSYFSAGSIDQTDDGGTTVGDFTPSDHAGALGYARLWGEWALGVTGKYVQSTIVETAHTLAMDAGVQSPPVWGDLLRFGASLRNAGGELRLGTTSRPLPLEVALGCAVSPVRGWLGTADLKFPRDNDPVPAFGIEGQFSPGVGWRLAGRAGWNGRPDNALENFAGLSLGVGLERKGWGLDYAFSPLGALGNVHHVTFKLVL